MSRAQPTPESKTYQDLIRDIENGIIRIPKFQRDFVWPIEKTAELLDSILKGYPIGTFVLWRTAERLNCIKKIGGFESPEAIHDGQKVEYVLDGQQRLASLFATYRGEKIKKTGNKKETDYGKIFVNLDPAIMEKGDQVITPEPCEKCPSLYDVLHRGLGDIEELAKQYSKDELKLFATYGDAFKTYAFSTVVLRNEEVDAAIEVFTRINTGGQTLTLFEIMSAKTYDEKQNFDMAEKWKAFVEKLRDVGYESVSSTVVLHVLSCVLSKTNECNRKTILALERQDVIDTWEDVISALEQSIGYLRTAYRIPVSELLPYDSLLVPFAYFFYKKKDKPQGDEGKYLREFFWRMSLSFRYITSAETRLAQDIKRIDSILKRKQPSYDDIRVLLDSPKTLLEIGFSTGNSFCKAVLCFLAYQEPKDFHDNGTVLLDNSSLQRADSRNYHHFFPKAYLRGKTQRDSNSLVNITFISDYLNKKTIRSKAPSKYIGDIQKQAGPHAVDEALKSHCIALTGFGIEDDNYETFLQARAKRIYDGLKSFIDIENNETVR